MAKLIARRTRDADTVTISLTGLRQTVTLGVSHADIPLDDIMTECARINRECLAPLRATTGAHAARLYYARQELATAGILPAPTDTEHAAELRRELEAVTGLAIVPWISEHRCRRLLQLGKKTDRDPLTYWSQIGQWAHPSPLTGTEAYLRGAG